MTVAHPNSMISFPAQLDNDVLDDAVTVETKPHTAWGGAVEARIHVPLDRIKLWQQLTTYSRWVEFFPDITHSEVVSAIASHRKRLRQKARKSFLMLTVDVEILLDAVEMVERAIKFRLASPQGSFADFNAELSLADAPGGTWLTYSVQATPKLPVPSLFVQEAMKIDLPGNMRHMRRVLLGGVGR
jgi:hypothetical protein